MTVYRNSAQQSSEVIVTEQETYQAPSLPGFELPLPRLLSVADRPLGRMIRWAIPPTLQG